VTPVGIFNPKISYLQIIDTIIQPASGTLSRYFTIALNEFPCATTITFLPSLIAEQIVSFQNGSTLSTVSFKHSEHGNASNGRLSYRLSNPGKRGSVVSNAGGLIS